MIISRTPRGWEGGADLGDHGVGAVAEPGARVGRHGERALDQRVHRHVVSFVNADLLEAGEGGMQQHALVPGPAGGAMRRAPCPVAVAMQDVAIA